MTKRKNSWPKQKPIRYVPPLYGPHSYTGLDSSPTEGKSMTDAITLTIEKADAEKIAEALNHVYREIFDKERAGEPLRALAQQISDKAQLGRRF
jgi:hypothetical protein